MADLADVSPVFTEAEAHQVCHVFHPIAEGQIRGVPWVAPAIVGFGKTGDRLLTAGEASQKARGQTEQTEHVRALIDTSFQITPSRR